jgi:hypothetical protein
MSDFDITAWMLANKAGAYSKVPDSKLINEAKKLFEDDEPEVNEVSRYQATATTTVDMEEEVLKFGNNTYYLYGPAELTYYDYEDDNGYKSGYSVDSVDVDLTYAAIVSDDGTEVEIEDPVELKKLSHLINTTPALNDALADQLTKSVDWSEVARPGYDDDSDMDDDGDY